MVYGHLDDKYLNTALTKFLELLDKLPKLKLQSSDVQNTRRNIQEKINNAGLI
jgi:hypothetical protein